MAERQDVPAPLRLLLKLYPESFRRRVGADLLATCSERWKRASGPGARLRFWVWDVGCFAADGLLERLAAARRRKSRERSASARVLDAAGLELRTGWRGLARSRGFATLAVATLGVGLGAATAIFSVADAVVFRGLPWPEAEQIHLVEVRFGEAFDFSSQSAPNLRDIRDRGARLGPMVGARDASPAIGGAQDPQRVSGMVVTPGYLALFGVGPARGRAFLEADHEPGAPRVALISDSLWRSRFGGRGDVLEQTLVVEGEPHAIVGVMPRDWRDPEELLGYAPPALWLPLRRDDPAWEDREAWDLRALLRLAPGTPRERAEAELASIGAALSEEFPDSNRLAGEDMTPFLRPLSEAVAADARPRMLLLLGAIALLLLVGCADVGHLFLTRAAHRAGEMEIRAALGASRGRLLAQLFAESLVVCAASLALGLGIAALGVRAFQAFGPEAPRLADAAIDGRALLASSLVALAAALVFGVAGLAVRGPGAALRVGARVADSRRTRRLRGALVVGQVAVAFTLLAGAGLLTGSFARLLRVDPGFDPEAAVVLELRPPGDAAAAGRFYSRLLERAGALPGARTAALMQNVPAFAGGSFTRFEADGRPETWDPSRFHRVNTVSEAAFRALGVPVVEGRGFEAGDQREGAGVAIVNEVTARLLWGSESPLGRRIRAGGPGSEAPWLTVVGVVAAVHQRSPGREPESEVFYPWGQDSPGRMRLVVKAAGAAAPLLPALRGLVRELDPAIPVDRLVTLRESVDATLVEARFFAALMASFAGLALLLAAVGLYGSVAYTVSREVQPLAVRLALGATRGQVVALVLGRGAALVAVGLALGVAGAAGAGRSLESLLFGVTPADPASLGGAAALLGLVSLLACAGPARRAARVETATVLRGE